jgi:Leucine-rich repeat (LRR) protein
MSTRSPITSEPRQFVIRLPRPMCLGVLLVAVAAAVADDPADDDFDNNIPLADDDSDNNIPPAQLLRIKYASNTVAAGRHFDMVLREKVAIVDQVCGLTDTQKAKLLLAGRGDKKRLIDRIEEIEAQLQLVKNDPDKVKGLLVEAELAKRGLIAPGLTERGSILVASLERLLTTEQAIKYAPLRSVFRARGVVKTWRRGSDDLVEFNLTGTGFADDDLAQLSAWPASPNLYSLNLTGTKVTDAGIRHLKKLSHVTELDLSHTQISDTGLDDLKKVTTLKHLKLRGLNERLSDAAAADLKRALPMLELHW